MHISYFLFLQKYPSLQNLNWKWHLLLQESKTFCETYKIIKSYMNLLLGCLHGEIPKQGSKDDLERIQIEYVKI